MMYGSRGCNIRVSRGQPFRGLVNGTAIGIPTSRTLQPGEFSTRLRVYRLSDVLVR